ncbi:MAG: hypothetical protein EOO27_36085, partial [Comamonadaceae bacterium]
MRSNKTGFAALGMSLLLVAAGGPAFAEDGDPVPAATVGLSGASGVMTLPAGDGVRDTATFTVTSDVATTLDLEVIGVDDTTVVKALAPIELTAESLVASVTVDVAGLPAGLLSLRATPAAGETVSTALRVGSGTPTTVTLSVSPKTVYTWSGSSARSTVATVSAIDETELAIPFTGSVTAVVGSARHVVSVTSPHGSATKATISASKLKVGTGTVTATVTANGVKATSDIVSLTVRQTAVTSAKVSRSASVVYPTKDGYMDSVKFSLSWKSSTGAAIPAAG